MKKKKLFSIIIPVKKINDYILLNVKEIKKQLKKSYEIIIVTDRQNLSSKFLNEKNIKTISSGIVGPARKRDIGFKHSCGEIIVFLDDDSYPAKNFFETARKIFRKKTIKVIGGPGMTPLKSSISEKLSGIFFSSCLGGGFPERYYPIGKLRFVEEWPTVNFLMRRITFKKVRGFGKDIWPGEDSFICKKLKNFGEKIYYEPRLKVWHHRRSSFLLHIKQVANYGLLRGRLCSENLNFKNDLKYYIPSVWFIILNILFFYSIKFNFLYLKLFLLFYFSIIFITLCFGYSKKNIFLNFVSLIYFFFSHFFYAINFLRSFIFR